MGEAKRRKQLDPNYGKPQPEEMIGGKPESEWRQKLRYSQREWKKVKPYFRVVETAEDVDESLDGIWFYTREDGKEMLSFTGSFSEDLFNRF